MKKVNVCFITLMLLFSSAQLRSLGGDKFNPDEFLKGGKIVSPPGTYGGGDTVASNDFLASLVDFAGFLKKNSRIMIRISGFTDNKGTERVNKRISFLRAQGIKDVLVNKLNIYKDRVFLKGFGSNFPIADNSTKRGRMANRRVEIQLMKKPPSIGNITSILRDVFTRAPQEIRFQRAELREPLFNRFRLNTGERSNANITLQDASKLNIGPDSLMVIYKQRQNDRPEKMNFESSEIKLQTGFLRTKLNSIRKGFRVKTPACEINSGSKVILVDISKDKKSAVSVFDGKSEVVAQKKSVNVPSGYGTFVKEGEKPADPEPLPAAPEIISPKQVEFFVSDGSMDSKRNIVFKWRSAEDFNHIQVASDKYFEKIVTDEKIKNNSASFDYGKGKYFWRVAAINVNGIEGYTAESSFIIKTKKVSIPLDIFPKVSNSLKEAHDFAMISKDRSITVKGKTISGSSVEFDGVTVKVGDDGSFSHIIYFHPGWNLINLIIRHEGYKTTERWISICYYPGLKHSRFYKVKSVEKKR